MRTLERSERFTAAGHTIRATYDFPAGRATGYIVSKAGRLVARTYVERTAPAEFARESAVRFAQGSPTKRDLRHGGWWTERGRPQWLAFAGNVPVTGVLDGTRFIFHPKSGIDPIPYEPWRHATPGRRR